MELFTNNIKIPFGGTISLKLYNPLFNDIGSHSLPVAFNGKLPAVKKAFGFPDKEETVIAGLTIEGRIKTRFVDMIGSWTTEESSDENINAYFKSSSGDFYSLIKDVLLTDLDFGGVQYLRYENGTIKAWSYMLELMDTKMNASYPADEYAVFCAYMLNAETSNGTDNIKFVNPVHLDEAGDPTFTNPEDLNNSVYLFAGTVIDYLFSNYGYRIEKNIFREDPDLKQQVIFNTFNICAPIHSPYYNQARLDYKNLLPRITCGNFIKAVRDRFNVGFFINEQSRSVRIVSFDSIIAAGSKANISKLRGQSVKNNRLAGIKFPLNSPDAWCEHSYLNSAEELADPIVVLTYRDILPDTRADGDLIFVQSEPGYYRIKFTAPATYEAIRLCPDQFPYSEGNGAVERTQLSGIPAMFTLNGETQYFAFEEVPSHAEIDYLLPRCDLVGNREGLPFTEFPLMFLSAHGIQNCWVEDVPGAPACKYPFGSSDVYDADGTKISDANMALKWGGVYGLIAKFWANRNNWEQNIMKLIKAEILNSDVDKILNFDEVKTVGLSNSLVNSFDVKMGVKTTVVENVELLRL